jgi:hypothetical protein
VEVVGSSGGGRDLWRRQQGLETGGVCRPRTYPIWRTSPYPGSTNPIPYRHNRFHRRTSIIQWF